MTTIHTKEIRLFPVVCKNRECPDFKQTKYLPFSERNMKWYLLPEATDQCQRCKNTYQLCEITHLALPNEDGQIHGSLEMSPGSFVEHPIKRWEFACEEAKRSFEEQSEDSIDFPKHFTTVPNVTTCYQCLETFAKLDKEENTKLMTYFKSKE